MVCFDRFWKISLSLLAVIAIGCGGDGGIGVPGQDGGDLGPTNDQISQVDTPGVDGAQPDIPQDGVPADVVDIWAPDDIHDIKFSTACETCDSDDDCDSLDAVCVDVGGEGLFCSTLCEGQQDCPESYECTGEDEKLCMPASGSCLCMEGNEEYSKECAVSNEFGECEGEQGCQGAEGWGECSAAVPSQEACDGIDNNCNDEVDEGSVDTDDDGEADCVDEDDDDDDVVDEDDNCPLVANADQVDTDVDGTGDVCDDETSFVQADAAETVEGEDVTIDVLANDTPPPGGSLSVFAFNQPLHGKAELLVDDTIRYVPPKYFNGSDEFEYTAANGQGETAVALVTVTITPVGADLYVALDGDDSQPGTLEQPFSTLERARQAVVDLKNDAGLPVGGVTVWLRGGTFVRTEGFDLGPADSGEEDKPIRYIGFPKEQVRLVGGQILNPGSFSEVTAASPMWDRLHASAKGNVWQVDIAAQGIVDYKLTGGGLTDDRIGGTEVFMNGQRLQIARWPDPDGGEFGFVRVDEKISDTEFKYFGNRPASWEPAENMMVHGYFAHYWCDYRARVSEINTATKTISLINTPYFGIKANRFYFAYNIFEEITQPGEWYLDRDQGILYLWPPDDLGDSEVMVTTPIGSDIPISNWNFVPDPILRLVNTHWVSFHDLTVEIAMNHLVEIEGGSHNGLVGCDLFNAGGTAVQLSGHDNGLERCEVGHAGNSAVRVSGGDRKSINLSNNYVRNCDIHHYSVSARTHHAAVWLDGGAGHIVEHNWIHHSPTQAIYLLGNEHVVQYNHIHDVCQWTDDFGAIYSHLDWGFRGNLIRYNFIHDLESPFIEETNYGVTGVYLDGYVGGISVFGNIIMDILGNGVLIGGGPDNIVENNVIVNTIRGMYSHNGGVTGIKSNGGNTDMLNKMGVDPLVRRGCVAITKSCADARLKSSGS